MSLLPSAWRRSATTAGTTPVEHLGIYVRLLRDSLLPILEDAGVHGYTIEVARSADEAQTMLTEQEAFDLIVVETQLPDEHGLSLVRWIRKTCPEQGPLIIMVADTGHDRDVLEALQYGVDDYVLKPFDEDRFERWADPVHARDQAAVARGQRRRARDRGSQRLGLTDVHARR